ncbi:MAG TPA: lipid-A-disaccharide synthase [Patescibacteria group bacterium]|nr:lipid-A-disaccharide synthase [Patescibacteria group bacterium]
MTGPLRIFIVAGEASGDLLGANLMRALHLARPDTVFYGVGGKRMAAEGLTTLFPMEELSVMGLAEVLPRAIGIMKRIRQTASEIVKTKPDAVITIDSPDFCFRVVRKARPRTVGTPFIHYVAPSVWAWRPGRAEKVSKFLDHLLTLLPFEPPYFEKHGLSATFVGHPVIERENRGDGDRFRQKHGLKPEQPILCMLPGSRMSELSRLLDKFSDTADIVLRNKHNAVIVIPTLPNLRETIDKFFVGKGINPILVYNEDEKFDAFAASVIAIAASGTVSLELAVSDTPHIIAYKLSPVSAWMAKKLVKTPYVNLVNILLKRPVVPELLLEQCEPGPMSKELLRLMGDKDARVAQLMDFREALVKIGLGDPETPGQKAAAAVLGVIEKRRAVA